MQVTNHDSQFTVKLLHYTVTMINFHVLIKLHTSLQLQYFKTNVLINAI